MKANLNKVLAYDIGYVTEVGVSKQQRQYLRKAVYFENDRKLVFIISRIPVSHCCIESIGCVS
jgi:hypothetical protein